MQPNYSETQTMWTRRLLGALITIVAILVMWWLVSFLVGVFTFHVSKTDPKLGYVGADNAYIDVYFNRDIVSNGLKISYSEPFVSKREIGNNKIRFTFITKGLVVDKSYSIILGHVTAKDGKQINNKRLTFSAKDVAVGKLSKAQQKALVSQQDQYNYSVQTINYANFDALEPYITPDQILTLKTQLYGYSNKVNKQFQTMALDKDSLVDTIHNVANDEFVDHITFNVTLGSQTLQANAASNVVDGSLQLQLTDNLGTVVYDSTNPDN